jgi:hypothetical protein
MMLFAVFFSAQSNSNWGSRKGFSEFGGEAESVHSLK